MGYAYATKIGVSRQATLLDDSVLRLARDDSCGFLSNSLTADEAETTLTARLRAYLNLVNSLGRDKRLPSEIEQTLTHAGEPLSAAIRRIRDSKVIESDVNVFVTIDQFETLLRKRQDDDDERKHRRFFDVLDELIASRDRTVSYRLGSRPNAILEKSEPLRDYHDINLNVILQRPEHSRRPLFRRFAEDVFRRRLVVSDFAEIADVKKPMRHVFGRSPTYAERAKLCARRRIRRGSLKSILNGRTKSASS